MKHIQLGNETGSNTVNNVPMPRPLFLQGQVHTNCIHTSKSVTIHPREYHWFIVKC